MRGRRGSAAEFGHLYVGGDQQCGCGAVGCLETWCSITGLKARAAKAGNPVLNGRELFEAVERSEPWAVEIRDQAGLHLGRGLASLANLFGPDEILVAGGLSAATGWRARAAAAFEAQVVAANRCPIAWVGSATTLAIRGAAALALGLDDDPAAH